MLNAVDRKTMDAPLAAPSPSPWRAVYHQALDNKVVLAGAGVAILIIMAAIIAPRVAKVDPEEQNFDLLESPPSAQAWFGTDRFGRDIYSRVVFGVRISLVVASISMATAMFFGGSLGLLSGYIGG